MLQTSIVDMIMRSIDETTFQDCNLFEKDLTNPELTQRYINRCKLIQKGCMADVNKSLVEGKAVIIEGYDLMPNLFLKNDKFVEDEQRDTQKLTILQNYVKNGIKIKTKLKSLNDYNLTDLYTDHISLLGQNSSGDSEDQNRPLIIPIILVLNQRDLKFNIENSRDIQNILDPIKKS